MVRFYEVIDRDRDRRDTYAVMAMSDQMRPGYTRAFRWIPNFETWVKDDGLYVDFRTWRQDQLNIFEEIDSVRAEELTRELPKFTAEWIIRSYEAIPERLTSEQLGLPTAPA